MARSVWRRLSNILLDQKNYGTVRALTQDNYQKIVASDDGNTVVCWHPEVEFPYEKSLPIKLTEKATNTVLKVQNVKEIMTVCYEKKPEFVRENLMKLTYTTKHRWFPEGVHKRRRKRNFDVNRPYL